MGVWDSHMDGGGWAQAWEEGGVAWPKWPSTGNQSSGGRGGISAEVQ